MQELQNISVLWDLMGPGNKILVPDQVKPQAAKETVNRLETIGTSGYRLEFVIEPFDDTAVGSTVEIVGNRFQMVAKGLEKFVKTVERTRSTLAGRLSKQRRPPASSKARLKIAFSSSCKV